MEDLAKTLGDPIVGELSDQAQNARRNLVTISSVVCLFSVSNFDPSKIKIFDMPLEGMTVETVSLLFALAVIYQLCHFGWLAFDAIGLLRIHITGTRLAHVTGAKYVSQDADYPDNPKSSNLYWWWQEKASFLGNWKSTAAEIARIVKVIEEKNFDLKNVPNVEVSTLKTRSEEMASLFLRLEGAILSERTKESLRRFDEWFSMVKTSQLLRLFVLEIGMPLAFGIISLFFVFNKIIPF
jgi:hypothetical protein